MTKQHTIFFLIFCLQIIKFKDSISMYWTGQLLRNFFNQWAHFLSSVLSFLTRIHSQDLATGMLWEYETSALSPASASPSINIVIIPCLPIIYHCWYGHEKSATSHNHNHHHHITTFIMIISIEISILLLVTSIFVICTYLFYNSLL